MIYFFFACLLASSQALFSYDAGYPGRWSGWGDVNGDRKADFCRFICPKTACVDKDVIFCCHLQGTTNQCGYKSEPGFESGKVGKPAALIDADGDGLADFCRLLTPPEGGDPVPYCRLAGKDGWTQNEIKFDYAEGQSGFKRRRL